MAAKTYTVQYMILLRAIAKYIARNQGAMFVFLSTDQKACVTAVANAVDSCIQAFGPRTVI